jgi:2,3-bisphosphoglycerate-independent phosphoglycerate mutase
MPNWKALLAHYAHGTIDASEMHVGLPDGQMGNSEVGHLNIGAGRVVYQDLTRIDHAIATGEFAANRVLNDALALARANGRAVHVLGLLSPGASTATSRTSPRWSRSRPGAGVTRVNVHAFLDGRDTPPKSAASSIAFIERACAKLPGARIATVTGRYYAMDRDQRWERESPPTTRSSTAARPSRRRAPRRRSRRPTRAARATSSCRRPSSPGRTFAPSTMDDGDVVVFMNFRADRARQLTRALTDPAFDGFPRARVPRSRRSSA